MDGNIKEYLAMIGRRGGQKSKRKLSRNDAKMMVRVREATEVLDKLPAGDIGCIYFYKNDIVREIDLNMLKNYKRHFGSIGASWPKIVD